MKKKHVFNFDDKVQIEKHGLTVDDVENQLESYKKGFPFAKLVDVATIGKGIVAFNKNEQKYLVDSFDECSSYYKIAKFVPASGAATRMFKNLFVALDSIEKNKDISKDALLFFSNIKQLAIYDELKEYFDKKGENIDKILENKDYTKILKALLNKSGLNIAALPKALIPFHRYENFTRTPLEEHIFEGLSHAVGFKNKLNIHFTIGYGQLKNFKKIIAKTLADLKTDVKINISYSYQQKNTDTIAVNIDNEPAYDKAGKLIFRPGGHGALLQNLNDIKDEMVFLKNIDNIVPDKHREDTIWYKKVIGGYLMKIVNDIHAFLTMLDDGNVDDGDLEEMIVYAKEKLNIYIPDWLSDFDKMEKIDFLYDIFNRPIRVCGMVKNEGEPGGGPFFTQDEFGNISLQIVETSQIDMNDKVQYDIFKKSKYFNPVDLVCWKNNFKDEPFNLADFSDPNAGFISLKSFEGKEIKAMEHPGLWNGAMAHWITIFVETPLSTFNPVKEITDLLRDKHI
ncbi:MAG: DUF4301 family protein [Bacteroidales bacterium]|nr:DUF4301 family protein [Bacteroidales bacterium]